LKYRRAKCDLCGKTLREGEKVTTILSTIITKKGVPRNKMRLVLSPNSITSRANRVYCNQCLDLSHYIRDPQNPKEN
jgi:hypothetical protein